MLKFYLSRAALIFFSGSLAVLTVGCSDNKQTTATGNGQPSVPVGNLAAIQPPTKQPASLPANPKPEVEHSTEPSALELALDKATGAVSISQSAQSPDDWNLVTSRFEDAIALMEQVRRDSPNFPFAQRKIAEYQRQIKLAKQKANPSTLASPVVPDQQVVVAVPQPQPKIQRYSTPTPTRQLQPLPPPQPIFPSSEILAHNNQVFIAPIKRRVGGTPIVEVTFNGRQRFEMIVDTGASGTVITQEIAQALGVVPVGIAKANTVSSKAVEFPVGYLDSMEVGGVMVSKVPVAIAGVELETGLLGHDFFGNYDVTIKRNVVEFRPQAHSEANPPGIQLTVPTLSRGYRFVEFP
ncbi:retroviral-like aspartic protease family protein [Anabaena sphaerica FACHB-251]|uniref:Retroviral-like aspartic protease family protein n=1 Tax=Anabaena sphaerica FACHB-251 TaxID=2692883 RepID=A0A926WLZ1_9NOST|nr:retropepsin-like aspartic protease [Anabaena sphaerica]MBD2296582.1 retroviral-like aspartic protease family protein [Anabaena sphaerica FACHB-251]